jgi:hypothetical protein
MKRFPLLAIVLLALTSLLGAQAAPTGLAYDWPTVSGPGPTTYLDLRGASAWWGNTAAALQVVSVSIPAGTNSVCTFQLEGSDDQVNWYSLSGSQSCLSPLMFTVAQRPARVVRINVLTYTGTATLAFHWTGR